MGRVIAVKGYKAFRGTLRVLWSGKEPEEIYGDWLYTPDVNYWHCGDKSYPADICMIVAAEQGKVIAARGYKMFSGIMRIFPPGERTEEIYGDWLYKPYTDRWYSDYGVDYPAEICQIAGVAK